MIRLKILATLACLASCAYGVPQDTTDQMEQPLDCSDMEGLTPCDIGRAYPEELALWGVCHLPPDTCITYPCDDCLDNPYCSPDDPYVEVCRGPLVEIPRPARPVTTTKGF